MRWLIAVLAVLTLAVAPLGANAGEYHSGTSLVCSDCHVAHYSVSHGYNPGDPAPTLGAGGPHKYLLKADGNELCLTCHDNQSFAPDVLGANGGVPMNRMGGGLNWAASSGNTNDLGYDEIDGHSLGSTATAPGGTFTKATGLECVDCHSQHGQNLDMYRNLRRSTSTTNAFLNKYISYEVGTPTNTKDVLLRATRNPTSPDMTVYAEANIDFEEPNTRASAMGAWCQSCHTNFHGQGGATNMGGNPAGGGDTGTGFEWLRHPTADVNIGQNSSQRSSKTGAYDLRTNKVKVMDPSNTWAATANAGVTPSCFSCHKSHGNQNAFGLIYMNGTGTVTEEGDGGVFKDLCRQCHVQGA